MDLDVISPGTSSSSPHPHPPKRPRPSSPPSAKHSPTSGSVGPLSPSTDHLHDGTGHGSAKSGHAHSSSSFRNVSACNRCRLRKNRCDQKLPSCASCEKARVACVGYDPITKREIPRSYVYYLETRVSQLETLLRAQNIPFPPAENLEYCSRPGNDGGHARSPNESALTMLSEAAEVSGMPQTFPSNDESARPNKIMRTDNNTTRGRYLGSANGVSFARVVFAAVQSSVGDHRSTSDKAGIRPYKSLTGNGDGVGGTSMRDSFFGLHTRPTISPAVFPDRDLALKLVDLYFEYANPQIPVLHRVDFMQMFEQAYAEEGKRGPRELYILNMVFAIGGGIIMDSQTTSRASGEEKKQAQPEEYHASAIIHLEACLNGGGLEELQAVLLLANFALLRPVPPGLWYIVGVAGRLAVDLGLYYEDGKDVEFDLGERKGGPSVPDANDKSREAALRERGRREYVRDLRRRLWWCTYAFDRIVSTCVGRPFGVSDQVITTEFPSMLEDRYITPAGIINPPMDGEPTYKVVAKHYLRLRLLQSEILQVLQYQQAQTARINGQNLRNEYMHTQLPSPFLSKFESFRSWRKNIDERLYAWKNSAPTKQDSGVAFSPEFLELNYWQAIIMLYRQSLSVPAMFESEYHTSKEVNSPSIYSQERQEDQERVYLKVAEAGQKILRLYRQLHLQGLVNYTYLATHHLFMAGVSYLYAIWHSLVVRSRLTMDEVDFTILAATSVFTDLIDKCPPAEACRDAFDRTAKATIKMANSNGGFGNHLLNRHTRGSKGSSDRIDYLTAREATANRQKYNSNSPGDQSNSRPATAYDASPHEQYTRKPITQMAAMQPIPQAPSYRIPTAKVKSEHDVYTMPRPMPETNMNLGNLPNMGTMPDNSAIDPILLPSQSSQVNSPGSAASLTPKSTHQQYTPQSGPNSNFQLMSTPPANFTPGPVALNLSDLQGMDFLQNIQDQSGGDGYNNPDMQMDMGFGIGWEGMHHDFSDGQQVDLFDGFFFGAPQGPPGNGPGV
ncbi:fungal-specific transcription factor domain-containing protein [Astrocystis sublimbata]|nr:fungal-specific transcription factor domain-containing protein [Astrocystis sublimbata]KAI0192493.1 fungal-specific transcription factor domain-containing protein [Astrocystis sublimbata]